MTKKKIIIYTVIFIISVICSAIFKYVINNDPAAKFNDACKNVVNPSCQYYLANIYEEKKYEEIIEIQSVRINENTKILKLYKKKIKNKALLKQSAKDVEKTILACIATEECKKDYFLIKTAELTAIDAISDLLTIAQIKKTEFKDTKSAQKALKHAKKILDQNVYISNFEKINEYINKEIAQIK